MKGYPVRKEPHSALCIGLQADFARSKATPAALNWSKSSGIAEGQVEPIPRTPGADWNNWPGYPPQCDANPLARVAPAPYQAWDLWKDLNLNQISLCGQG